MKILLTRIKIIEDEQTQVLVLSILNFTDQNKKFIPISKTIFILKKKFYFIFSEKRAKVLDQKPELELLRMNFLKPPTHILWAVEFMDKSVLPPHVLSSCIKIKKNYSFKKNI